MSFHQQSWNNRKQSMGAEAEGIFEQVHEDWARTGLNLPPFKVNKLPLIIRNQPDYIMEDCYWEVQGCGKAGLRVKVEKLRAMTFWDEQHPLHFFIWSTPRQQYAELSFQELLKIIDRGDANYERYEEGAGKALYRITPSKFDWQDFNE